MAEVRQEEDIVKVEVEEEAQEVLAGRQSNTNADYISFESYSQQQSPFKDISEKKAKIRSAAALRRRKKNIVETETEK